MKLTQLRGSEVLPVKQLISTGSAYQELRNDGFNKAVSTIEQVSVEVDEPEAEIQLIPIRYKDKDPFFMYHEGIMSKRKLISVIVKELSKCKQKWLKLEVRNNGT